MNKERATRMNEATARATTENNMIEKLIAKLQAIADNPKFPSHVREAAAKDAKGYQSALRAK